MLVIMSWYVTFFPWCFFKPCALTRANPKIGGSYVTTPRQAGRRTLRKFLQRNYPYAWNGGRVVYDVAK